MSHELIIRPMRAEEAAEAKRLVYRVAHPLMAPQMSLAELTAQWEGWGILSDIDQAQKIYFENGGMFLVTLDGGQMVGTGAFERVTEVVCTARRIALLPEYWGQKLGYAMMMELIHRARAMGYSKMTLWTNPFKLTRAVAFYHQLGFVDVPHAGADEDELWMEKEITQPV
jgi:GNAT superfamily N-acetyltransferase